MSLCDKCYDPGRCCKRLHLTFDREKTNDWIDQQPDTKQGREALLQWMGSGAPLPFIPADKVDGTWYWTCPQVDKNGRCRIYETRPQLCRDFEPASDGLCVHYRGAEAGDSTVAFH